MKKLRYHRLFKLGLCVACSYSGVLKCFSVYVTNFLHHRESRTGGVHGDDGICSRTRATVKICIRKVTPSPSIPFS